MAAPQVDVVDTVGAGDTLNGALAAGLAAGLDLVEAARRAGVAASLAVTRAAPAEGCRRRPSSSRSRPSWLRWRPRSSAPGRVLPTSA